MAGSDGDLGLIAVQTDDALLGEGKQVPRYFGVLDAKFVRNGIGRRHVSAQCAHDAIHGQLVEHQFLEQRLVIRSGEEFLVTIFGALADPEAFPLDQLEIGHQVCRRLQAVQQTPNVAAFA